MSNDSDTSPEVSNYRGTGFRLFAILIAAIIIGERSINLAFSHLGLGLNPVSEIVGALIMIAFLFPVLYFAIFKDMVQKNKMLASTEGRLRAAHNWLEQCINERTTEIKTTNEKLEGAVKSLKLQRNEMVVLAEMAHMLQACSVVEEACGIVVDHLHRLFPNVSGALYLKDRASGVHEKISAWGKGVHLAEQFEQTDCWALRNTRPHQVDGRNLATVCSHRNYEKSDWHLCLPIMAHGEVLGVICVQEPHDSDSMQYMSEDGRVSDDRLRFYVMMADSLALGIANLRMRETLQQQAVRDPLTDMYNRRYFDEALEREISRAMRSGEPLSLVLLDIDKFKQFNDSQGHAKGDDLLKAVAERLLVKARDGDIACRLGGDEFVAILPGASAEVVARRFEKLNSEIQALAATQGEAFTDVSVSVGIAEFPRDGRDKNALINAADKAMYRAKRPQTLAPMLAEPEEAHMPATRPSIVA